MQTGFLILSTHPEHAGLVRASIHEQPPELKRQQDGSEIRYVARFTDGAAALMHVQNAMHAALVDLEDRIYRKPLAEMIACVEADNLDHRRIWIDPGLDAETVSRIEHLAERRRSRQRLFDRIWQAVGILALLFLLINSLLL